MACLDRDGRGARMVLRAKSYDSLYTFQYLKDSSNRRVE